MDDLTLGDIARAAAASGLDEHAVRAHLDLLFTGRAAALRDDFASKAMQGLIVAAAGLKTVDGPELVRNAYKFADAMLAERKK